MGSLRRPIGPSSDLERTRHDAPRTHHASAGSSDGWALALGGGAVLGYAHIGLLQAFEEAGLVPEAVAGTSAGALVAALYAHGVPPDDMAALLGDVGWRTVADVSLRRRGLLTNREVERLLLRAVGEVEVDGGHRPLAIVTADIRTGDRVVVRDGPLAPAVRASMALPGLFEPVEADGRWLVDGGLVENVPVYAARELREGPVVAVSLEAGLDSAPRTFLGALINAFEIFALKMTRLQLAESGALVIRPELAGFNPWDTRQRAAIQSEGRRAGETAVPRILAALGA